MQHFTTTIAYNLRGRRPYKSVSRPGERHTRRASPLGPSTQSADGRRARNRCRQHVVPAAEKRGKTTGSRTRVLFARPTRHIILSSESLRSALFADRNNVRVAAKTIIISTLLLSSLLDSPPNRQHVVLADGIAGRGVRGKRRSREEAFAGRGIPGKRRSRDPPNLVFSSLHRYHHCHIGPLGTFKKATPFIFIGI